MHLPPNTSAATSRRHAWPAVVGVAAIAAIAVATSVLVVHSPSAAVPASTSSTFVPIVPCRLLDTRPGDLNVAQRDTPLGANETHTVTATGERGDCLIPAGATALSMNIVAIAPTASSYLTVFPAGVTRPTSSSLNWVARQAPTANAVTSALGADGGLSFYNLTGTVDLAVDVVGYFTEASPPAAGAPGPQGSTGPVGPTGESANPARIVHVATSGGQFDSVADALASITDASAGNRYVIRVAPGIYDEADPLTMKDFVDIEGSGDDTTVLRSASSSGTIVVGSARTVLRNLKVTNSGGLAIDARTASPRVLELHGVAIDVSGGATTSGIMSDQQLVADDLVISAAGTGSTRAVDLTGGSAEITRLTVDITAGSACRAISVSAATVDVSGADLDLGGCELSFGVLAVTATIDLHDARITALASISAAAVWVDDSEVIGGGLIASATGTSTSHGLRASGSTVSVSGSDIRSASVAVESATSDMLLTDSVVAGTTTGMSTSCIDVVAVDLSPYTCT